MLGAHALLQVLLPVFQRRELLVGRAVVIVPVHTRTLAPAAGLDSRKSAWAMEAQIRIQLRRVELLKGLGMFGANGSVADVLAHHRPVFAFHQSVVGRLVRSRFGELLHHEFAEQPHHLVIRELRSVVAVKANEIRKGN